MATTIRPHYGGSGELILVEIPGDGKLWVFGTSVPANGTAGYAKGCIFVDTDASAGSVFYINEGSNSSCTFNVAL